MTRYAMGTKVSVQDSRGEITGILAKYGVERMGWHTSPEGDELLFELGGRRYRFSIVKPSIDEAREAYMSDGRSEWGFDQLPPGKGIEDEWRRRWRANVLLLKAKLEFADGETTTIEAELMPYLLIAGGRQTLAEWIETEAGQKLLPAGS